MPIGAQVTDVLRNILSEYPEDVVLKPAAEAPPRTVAPPVFEPKVELVNPTEPLPERTIVPPGAPAFAERPAMVPPTAIFGGDAEREAPPPPPPPPSPRPAAARPDAARPGVDIQREFDLPHVGHRYFYELEGGTYQKRLDFLNAAWDDPDSDVYALVKMLPAIEKTFTEDPRVPFAAGVLNMLAEKRVASLTGFNRALDLLDALGDYEGARVILKLLHGAFPDDVGVTERLVDVLDRLGHKPEAAAILEELAQVAHAKDHAKRALAYLERAAQLDATNPRVALAQVKIYRAIGDESRVLEAANRGLASRADDGLLLFFKAQALSRLGRTRAAETCMEKALARAANDLALLRTLREECRLAADERDRRRVEELMHALAPGEPMEAGHRAPPPVDEEDEPAPRAPVAAAPIRVERELPPPPPAPITQPSRLLPAEPAPVATSAPSLTDGDLFARVRQRFARLSADLTLTSEIEADLAARRSREMIEDKQVVELLRKLESLGGKLKNQAPDEAAQMYHRALSYLPWFRDPFMAVAWRDELEKKIKSLKKS